jgi:hypothetical protein
MVRGRRKVGTSQVLGGLVVLAIGILVIKWLLITAAILIVPFGIWWLYDRAQVPATTGGPATPTDAVTTPLAAAPRVASRRAPTPTHVAPGPEAARTPVLAGDRDVVVTREEDHQDVLARHHRAGSWPTDVVADLYPAAVSRGKHRGAYAIEVRVDGDRVGELTAAMSARYRPQLHPTGHARAAGRVSHGDRGFQLDLRLPAVS